MDTEIKSHNVGAIALLVIVLLIAFTYIVYADRNIPAPPEIQGLSTSTGVTAQGTVTEMDSAAWSTTNSGETTTTVTVPNDIAIYLPPVAVNQLISNGGSVNPMYESDGMIPNVYAQITIPESLLNTVITGTMGTTWGQLIQPSYGEQITVNQGGLHSGIIDPSEVRYTTGYNAQYSGISGQQTFTKSVGIATANEIASGSNINAKTNIQYVAVDTGRATNSEDLLLDGAANSTDTASAILCPFAEQVSAVIPAYCNIVQAGSSFDSTLTSTVTSANDRFVGTDSTLPVVLNYNVVSKGITLSDGTSSPMIGSASAYMKVHVQEARNASVTNNTLTFGGIGLYYLAPSSPIKSEDLVYSESSTASGLINGFSKSMSYQSGFNLI